MFNPSKGKKALRCLLENKKILKVLHDCRNDWDSLLYQFKVRLFNFLDTQEVNFVYDLFYDMSISLPISLYNFLDKFSFIQLDYKKKLKNEMSNDFKVWAERPLPEERLIYAAEDVQYLLLAWHNAEIFFNHNLLEIVLFFNKDFHAFNSKGS